MGNIAIVLIVLCSVFAVGLIGVVIALVLVLSRTKNKQNNTANNADAVRVVDGVRYSEDTSIKRADEPVVGHLEGDIVLQQGTPYTAKRDGKLLPGKYTVLASAENVAEFNVRLGTFVRVYKHGDSIVIGDGETVTAVSCSVILR